MRNRRRLAEQEKAANIPSAEIIRAFIDYQHVVEATDERKQRTVSLMGLVGEVGDLHSMMKKLILQKSHPSLRDELCEEFGDLLWYLTSLAVLYGISLEEIATKNAAKAKQLFSEGSVSRFDVGYADDERLPRQFTVNFYEKPLDSRIYVRVSIHGVVIGDALTDNSHKDDGYRFHDVFHLAYAAVLGWSPVCRGLLRCKRKSDPRVDEIEDGARAAIIEEAISILIFNQASDRGWYADANAVDIGLLKTIRRMAKGLEVQSCTAKQWQNAILQGYAVFERLKTERGGDVSVDLDRQKIEYVPAGRRKGK